MHGQFQVLCVGIAELMQTFVNMKKIFQFIKVQSGTSSLSLMATKVPKID